MGAATPNRAAARPDRDTDPDSGERREQGMRERADQAADHEGPGHGFGAAGAESVGAVVGGRQVEDVLDEREADAHHAGVHDAVQDAVELASPPPQEQEQERALARLLGQRGHHRQAERLRDGDNQLPDPADQQRGGGRDEPAPGQTEGQQRAGLGLVAVQPEVRRHQRPDRQRGEEGRHHHRRGGAGEPDDQRHRKRADGRDHGHRCGEGEAVAACGGHVESLSAGFRSASCAGVRLTP